MNLLSVKLRLLPLILSIGYLFACTNSVSQSEATAEPSAKKELKVGAEQMHKLIRLLEGKRVGAVVNQSSLVGHVHLVDTLLSREISLKKIFAPEHGYRGGVEAGEKVDNGIDQKTGLPVLSLYGKNKSVPNGYFDDLDIVIFDLQDVGTRFYTYISTMHYVMAAAVKADVSVLVLDRPNPNGHIVDGPVKEEAIQSFVAMHKIPIAHGMTIGEYAGMINGQGWLPDGAKCKLGVLAMTDYDRNMIYELPIRPSPNLPNYRSILLYPSLCLFEGTALSVGRGTSTPFQIYGHPDLSIKEYEFTPLKKNGGWAPKLVDEKCFGKTFVNMSISDLREQKFTLKYIIEAYQAFPDKPNFFLKNKFFDTLAGTAELRAMIIAGKSEKEIKASWAEDLAAFKNVREKYLIY